MTQTSPPEAPLVEIEAGLKPDGEGWFVVNVSESVARASEDAGHAWPFEDPAHRFPHFGLNVHVLQPGEPACKYHAEEAQEGFLVLQGECVLVVGDEERRLRQWDLFHAPPWTPHVLVGAGAGPCAVLMVGARFSQKASSIQSARWQPAMGRASKPRRRLLKRRMPAGSHPSRLDERGLLKAPCSGAPSRSVMGADREAERGVVSPHSHLSGRGDPKQRGVAMQVDCRSNRLDEGASSEHHDQLGQHPG